MARSFPRPDGSAARGPFVCVSVHAPGAALAERLVAEAHAAGASGVEERPGEGRGILLLVYAPAEAGEAVAGALAEALGRPRAAIAPQPVAACDWATAWRAGLGRERLTRRLAVRPPFVAPEPEPGVAELVIDPGQAFGTGHHASTRLALELLEEAMVAGSDEAAALGPAAALPAAEEDGAGPAGPGLRVLDVGTGSGILALGALALGAGRAVGLDLDRVAVAEAARNARDNGRAEGLALYAGSLDALAPGRFPLIAANLLRRELLPLVPALWEQLGPSGRLVLSGLLVSERPPVEAALAAVGLGVRTERTARDGGEDWLALLCAHAG